ncbi:MAG: ribonuclease T [Gammaproteobacteria bacterium]|nr:ribonuclease T [Gammaproteobacteria bacterium]
MADTATKRYVSLRFRGFLPVAVDVETGGFNPATDALLEIAAVTLRVDEQRRWHPHETHHCHVLPFPGSRMEPESLEVTGIDPYHPFRMAVTEREALRAIFKPIRQAMKASDCARAVLVGHNPSLDLAFINAAAERAGVKRNPFHPFTTFDTATLGGVVFGQTVLSRAVEAAGLDWDAREAHSALYDAQRTALFFCEVVNRWERLSGGPPPLSAVDEESEQKG